MHPMQQRCISVHEVDTSKTLTLLRTENNQLALGFILAVPVLGLQRIDAGVLPGRFFDAEVSMIVHVLDLSAT